MPVSSTPTFGQIQTEFGGSNPINLSEYYAGGSYVSSVTYGQYGKIPSSGQISAGQFGLAPLPLMSNIAANLNESTSVAIPIHQAGDLIIGFGHNNANGTVSVGGSWAETTGGYINSGLDTYALAWKEATSGSESFGTWTDALITGAIVIRNGFFNAVLNYLTTYNVFNNANSFTLNFGVSNLTYGSVEADRILFIAMGRHNVSTYGSSTPNNSTLLSSIQTTQNSGGIYITDNYYGSSANYTTNAMTFGGRSYNYSIGLPIKLKGVNNGY